MVEFQAEWGCQGEWDKWKVFPASPITAGHSFHPSVMARPAEDDCEDYFLSTVSLQVLGQREAERRDNLEMY